MAKEPKVSAECWRAAKGIGWLATLVVLPSLGIAQQRVETTDHALEVYLSNDAMQALYIRGLDIDNNDLGPVEVRGGFFYNEQRDLIATGDMLVSLGDLAEDRVIQVRAGARAYGAFLAVEDRDVFGVGIGGEAEYFLGRDRNTSIKLGLFYAPDIVLFGEADDVKDMSLRLQTELRDGTDVFVGFRAFEIDLPVDREVDDNVHVGFRRSF